MRPILRSTFRKRCTLHLNNMLLSMSNHNSIAIRYHNFTVSYKKYGTPVLGPLIWLFSSVSVKNLTSLSCYKSNISIQELKINMVGMNKLYYISKTFNRRPNSYISTNQILGQTVAMNKLVLFLSAGRLHIS